MGTLKLRAIWPLFCRYWEDCKVRMTAIIKITCYLLRIIYPSKVEIERCSSENCIGHAKERMLAQYTQLLPKSSTQKSTLTRIKMRESFLSHSPFCLFQIFLFSLPSFTFFTFVSILIFAERAILFICFIYFLIYEVNWISVMPLIYRLWRQSSDKSSNLPKVTHLINEELWPELLFFNLQMCDLSPTGVLLSPCALIFTNIPNFRHSFHPTGLGQNPKTLK